MNSLRHEENLFQNRFHEPIIEQLHIVEVNEFLPQISKWINIGGVVLLVIFTAGSVLTSVLHYKVTVKVPGNIRPLGELRMVQPAITGVVQKVSVRDNQLISQGQAIAYIDNSRLQTQSKQLQNSIQQSKLQLAQIDAQLDQINIQILSQTELNNRTIIAAQAELTANERNYKDQQIKTNLEMTQAETGLRLAKIELERLRRENVVQATVNEAQSALNLAKLQRDRLRETFKAGAISRNLFEEKEQTVISSIAKFEQAKMNTKNLLDEKQEALEIAQAHFDQAMSAINPSNAAVTVAQERIKQEKAKGESTLAALKKEQETLVQQRLETQKQMVRNLQEIKQIKTDLGRTIIRAPISGTILQMKLRNSGQVVQSGEAIAEIAPLHAPLLIKAYVQAKDISKIKVGEKVQMRVSACPYPDYGTLKGHVTVVAPDALQMGKAQGTGTNGMAAYEVNIQPETLYIGRDHHLCYLQSGMEGRVDIISREETLLQFILRKARLMTDF